MKKRGVILSLIISIVSTMLLPFSISANGSLSAPFVGYNIFVYDYEKEIYVTKESVDFDFSNMKLTCSNMQSSGGCMTYSSGSNVADLTGNITYSQVQSDQTTYYTVQVILDETYVGYVRVTQGGTTRSYYINGNQFEFVSADNTAISIASYSLTKKSSVQSLEQIISLLTDIEDEVDDIEPILNALLDKTDFNFPIESYSFVSYWIGLGKSPISFYNDSYYTFPMFELSTNDQIWRSSVPAGESQIVIFGIDKYITGSNFDSFFTIPSGFSVQYENVGLIPLSTSSYGRLVKYTFTNNNSSSASVILNYIGSNTRIMPIYSRNSKERFISTDFALQFGLNNQLLEDLHNIANGTQGSNDSVSNLDDATSDLNDSISDYVGVENSFNNDMNTALNDIPVNNNLPTAMGTKFLQSANWVRVQFTRLTDNNPFGSVLSFSLVVGIALLVLGKIYK